MDKTIVLLSKELERESSSIEQFELGLELAL